MPLLDLGQLIPLVGAGAQGYMQGSQAKLAQDQIRQLMALRDAEELRTGQLHPVRMAAAQQDISQSRDLFPSQLEGAGLKNMLGRQEADLGARMQGMGSPSLEAFLEQNVGGEFGGLTEDQQWKGAGLVRSLELGREATRRKGMESGAERNSMEGRLLRLYNDALNKSTPKEAFDYILNADPEVAAAVQGHASTGDRRAFMEALRVEIKRRYGYDVLRSSMGAGRSSPSYLEGLPAPQITFSR